MKKILLGIIVLTTLNSCYKTEPTEKMDLPIFVGNEINKVKDSSFVEYSIIKHEDYVYFISNEREIKHIYFNNNTNGDYYVILVPLFFVYLIMAFVLGLLIAKSTD